MFERQDEFELQAHAIFNRLKPRDTFHRLGSLAFVPKGTFRAHEAADLIAYRIRKVITRLLAGKPAFTDDDSWDAKMKARNNLAIGYYDRDRLREAVQYIEQQRGIVRIPH